MKTRYYSTYHKFAPNFATNQPTKHQLLTGTSKNPPASNSQQLTLTVRFRHRSKTIDLLKPRRIYLVSDWTSARARRRSSHRIGPSIPAVNGWPSSIPKISNRPSTRRRARIRPPLVVRAIAAANRNINGTDYWPTIRITIVKGSLWIGSCFLPVVFAGVIPPLPLKWAELEKR